MSQQPLSPDLLFTPCDPALFSFSTTEELAETGLIVGQDRALEAIRFGLGVKRSGFNIFALGPTGHGKLTAVRDIVSREADALPAADDWCYVNNFEDPAKPKALRLPAGRGGVFARAMERLIEELSVSIPATFEGEEYRTRAEQIEDEGRRREQGALNHLRAEARAAQIELIETSNSFAFVPIGQKNEPLAPDQFEKLSEEQQQALHDKMAHLHQQLQKLLRQFPSWRKEAKEKVKSLNREFAVYAISHLVETLKENYADLAEVCAYLDRAEQDIIEHADDFFPKSEGVMSLLNTQARVTPLQRYRVNLLVDHTASARAPIVEEILPSHVNLIGRVEHQAYMGALVTDFSMVRPGALHRANGGYLILDAHKLLMQPYAWETLKRTLQTGEIRIESLERTLGLISTTSLEPEPIPLQAKIVLTGDRLLYYLLSYYDPEFADLFKIAADFEESLTRSPESSADYARVIASLALREKLRPLDRDAVVRVVEHSARLAEDAEKLSIRLRSLNDLLKEADYLAEARQAKLINRDDIQAAIDRWVRRSDRVRERIYEAIRRGQILISVDGEVVGQINGLSVIGLGDFSFGQPSRITATTRLGSGKIVDIERETELGGPLHSKGVLILSSFIASRYATTSPFSVAASLVFEQSYGQVEGDSASLAELCAILSSLSGLPIRQSLAVTGSVNQLGQVQPIGGVNEKIEGYFDVCRELGFNGRQGVIIPASNVKNLMLRQDVVEAARNGQFQVYAVETVDQALALLTGQSAGVRDEAGEFAADTVNGRVERRLKEFSEIVKQLAKPDKSDKD
ncbi:Lon protease family protein [Methylococcus sp. EFPC2]|uniref:Lon protease family protein n=1 Tax=Methylococcus sp. EFPC2 TaxID=2812648 RepID=UPI00196864D8|nr:ATP-binding protein [Methylococcus sp. EFPC2]QSA97913.1 AAA family ATPase [Methylococcus sp. EFPC2]